MSGLATCVAAGCDTTTSETGADAGVAETSPPTATPFTEEAIRSARIYFNAKYCVAMHKCDPVRLATEFGTLEKCLADDVSTADILVRYGYGSTRTPDGVRACADALALDVSPCDAYVRWNYERVFPEACRASWYGTLPDGSACGDDDQCASGRCVEAEAPNPGPVPYECRRCIPAVRIGERCNTQNPCEAGSRCMARPGSPTGKCVKLREVGEECDDATTFCHLYLVCARGRCAAPAADRACDPEVGCSPVPLLHACSAANRCEPFPLAGLGETCAEDRPCVHGATCTRVPTLIDGGTTTELVCTPKLEEGAACDPAAHPLDNPCKAGFCNNSRKCGRIDPAQCTRPAVPR